MYAPKQGGVYGISNAREWISIGQTDDIRSALLTHLRDDPRAFMSADPQGFVYEVCPASARSAREARLTAEYGPKRKTEAVQSGKPAAFQSAGTALQRRQRDA